MRFVKYMLIIGLLFFSCQAAAAEDAVETVSVQVIADREQAVPLNVAKRMTKSVGTIGEQLLVGHKTAEVAAKHEAYEKLIQEVFDRVLVGYSVQSVQIAPGHQNAEIFLKVAPWGDTVQQAVLEVDFGGASPPMIELMRQDIGSIQETIDEALVGLPVDAVEWAGSAAKSVLREQLEARIPEFRSSIDVIAGKRTVVKLTLSPTSPVVQNVQVVLRSRSIPNILLEKVRSEAETAVNDFAGMPASFIDRHRAYFMNRLSDITAHHVLTRRYGVEFTPSINAAAETIVTLQAETNLYNVSLDGYLDVGHREDNTSFKLHVGKNFASKAEVFLETTFIPGNLTGKFTPGFVYRYDHTAVGFKYDIRDQHSTLLLNQYIGNNWLARFERTPADGKYEFGIRYKLHEFISAEYVFTNNDRWLRLIGHL